MDDWKTSKWDPPNASSIRNINIFYISYIHIYLINTVVFWFFGEIHFGIDCGTRDSGSDVAPNTNCLIVWHAPSPNPQRIQTLQHTKPQTL